VKSKLERFVNEDMMVKLKTLNLKVFLCVTVVYQTDHLESVASWQIHRCRIALRRSVRNALPRQARTGSHQVMRAGPPLAGPIRKVFFCVTVVLSAKFIEVLLSFRKN
jgi:hypothetical protein